MLWMVDTSWYLDQKQETWASMAAVDICEGLTSKQCSLVLGGGAAMWGEKVDASNIFQTIFPRLAAVAEALWCCPLSDPRACPMLICSHASMLPFCELNCEPCRLYDAQGCV